MLRSFVVIVDHGRTEDVLENLEIRGDAAPRGR